MRKLKLLKSQKISEKDCPAGTIIEVDDDAVAGKMLLDGVAENYVEKAAPSADEIEKAVGSAVEKAVAKINVGDLARKSISIEVKDKFDEDPSHGYLPNGKAKSKNELFWAFGQFCKDVMDACKPNGTRSERLVKAQSKMQEIRQKAAADGYLARVDADGGFMIAPEFSTALLDATLETAVVRPLARKITLGSSSIKLPQYKNYDHSSNVFGGLIAYWKGENAQLTAVHGNLEEVGLELNPLTVLCAVSHQMMKFSPESVGSWLLPQMAATVAWTEDKGFISGNGAGQPLGILNAGCTVSQAIESGQVLSTGAIVTENILKMSARHRVENPASVAWLYNKADLLPWLGKLSIVVGVGGSAVGLVSRMTDSPQLMLMGNPLKETEHTKAAGTVGDIILIDGSQYIVADDRTGPEVAQSVDLYFDYGQSCFRLIKYVDGQPRYRTYFTKANGTNTIAPFLTLAARSN